MSTQEEIQVSGSQISGTFTETNEEMPGPSSSVLQKNNSNSVNAPSTQIKKTKRMASNSTNDPMLEKAFALFQENTDRNTDSYFSFGQHIANELRIYDPRTLAVVKQAVNSIIFDADMGRLPYSNYGYLLQQSASPAYTQSSAGTPVPTPSPAFQTSSNVQNVRENESNGSGDTDMLIFLQ
jgi:hypothetical protein